MARSEAGINDNGPVDEGDPRNGSSGTGKKWQRQRRKDGPVLVWTGRPPVPSRSGRPPQFQQCGPEASRGRIRAAEQFPVGRPVGPSGR